MFAQMPRQHVLVNDKTVEAMQSLWTRCRRICYEVGCINASRRRGSIRGGWRREKDDTNACDAGQYGLLEVMFKQFTVHEFVTKSLFHYELWIKSVSIRTQQLFEYNSSKLRVVYIYIYLFPTRAAFLHIQSNMLHRIITNSFPMYCIRLVILFPHVQCSNSKHYGEK